MRVHATLITLCGAQLRKFARTIADQILAGKNPHEVQTIA